MAGTEAAHGTVNRRSFHAQTKDMLGGRYFATVDVDLGAGWVPDRRAEKAPDDAIYQERNRLRLEMHKLRAALTDIALCRIPGVPDGVTVGASQFMQFARDHAKEAAGL